MISYALMDKIPGGAGVPTCPGILKSLEWVPLFYHAKFEVIIKSNWIIYRKYKNLQKNIFYLGNCLNYKGNAGKMEKIKGTDNAGFK